MADVQASADRRNLAIQRVGVKSVTHPVTVRTADGGALPTVATFDMYVMLPASEKGTHMSRFIEILDRQDEPLEQASLMRLFERMLLRLDATQGYLQVRFSYFVRKHAPVSGVGSLMDYQASCTVERKAGSTRYLQQVSVPVTSLCPCSKAISAYGAHNQRSQVTITAELRAPMSLEAQIRIAEQAASCELWGLLKRPDEKYVTETAYENPKFVEDLVRDIAGELNRDDRVAAYIVESENFESIHNHSAYALIEKDKRISA